VRVRVWCSLLALSGCGDSGSDSTGGGPAGTDDSDSSPPLPPALELDGDATAGGKIFETTCGTAQCHGPDGSGGSTNAEDLRKVVPLLTDVFIVTVMTDGYLVMPPQRLEDQQMADVLAYLRATWGP
jgi:mono/diheme cytochrome c family protein